MEQLNLSRRAFVKFITGSTLALQSSWLAALSGCQESVKIETLPFSPIGPSSADDLVLAEGFHSNIIVKWGEKISDKEMFGFNNDFLAYIPVNDNEAILWVNHENIHPMFVSGDERTKEHVDTERYNVGGSLLKIKKGDDGLWKFVFNDHSNRRITAATKIPIVAPRELKGGNMAAGTLANCAGGLTPWGSVLSCEENYQDFYGDYNKKGDQISPAVFQWDRIYPESPEHYGWVVEVNPLSGEAKKLTSLGRFSHECATCTVAADGRTVVYSGDDKKNEFIYKFISKKVGSLEEGELFVANLEEGRWMSLDIEKSSQLKQNFKDQLEVLTYAREAARMLGATPCDRPEDIEIRPGHGDVYICCTNNYDSSDLDRPKNNLHGQILKIVEENKNPLSLNFSWSNFVVGGEELGLSCPDNLTFDKRGNLWVTSDISGSQIGKGPYQKFKNNGLFYLPLSGPHAGEAFQVASAPVDAELTGPCFSEDYKTLFISVQHPGERSVGLERLTSHWPEGNGAIPRPSVLQISGLALERLMES